MASAADRLIQQGIEQGIQQGIQQGVDRGRVQALRDAVSRQLAARFGALEPETRRRIAEPQLEELEAFIDRVVTAEQLADVFEPDPLPES